MSKKIKQVQNTIPEDEIRLASIYFALGNLAMEFVFTTAKNPHTGHIDLKYAWDQSENILITETGVSGEGERADWEDTIRAGSLYCNEDWNKERVKFI